MRVLYIHQYFATRKGHTGTRSYEQARRFAAEGHRVVMLTTDACLASGEIPSDSCRSWRGPIEGIDAIVLRIPYRQDMPYRRRVCSFFSFMIRASLVALIEPRLDVIFATSTPLTVGVPALLALFFRRIPFIFEVRDLWPDVPIALGAIRNPAVGNVLLQLERLTYRHAQMIVASNEDVANAIRRKIRRGRRVLVVPNACDIDLFRPTRDGSAFRREYGLNGKTFCVHTGSMGYVNGLDAVIDAARELKNDPLIRFVMIGTGSERARLRARVEEEALHNVMVLDSVPKEKVADILATADIGLMTVAPIPILELNCANKFFDYLASGLPIVLNYRGWQGEILEQNVCGLSVLQGDHEGFCAAIRRLAHDTELRLQMKRNARRIAETVFCRDSVLQPILQHLSDMEASRNKDSHHGKAG